MLNDEAHGLGEFRVVLQIVLGDFPFGEPLELMAHIVDPELILVRLYFNLSAPVVGGDGKMLGNIFSHFVVVDRYLYIASGQASIHDHSCKIIDCAAGIEDIVEMAAVAAGGLDELRRNPFILLYAEPTTPLEHTRDSLEKLLYMAENDLPFLYAPGMLRGGTAPVTLAGCLALANAESLTGLLIAQLKREGAPVVLGGGALVMDIRTSVGS